MESNFLDDNLGTRFTLLPFIDENGESNLDYDDDGYDEETVQRKTEALEERSSAVKDEAREKCEMLMNMLHVSDSSNTFDKKQKNEVMKLKNELDELQQEIITISDTIKETKTLSLVSERRRYTTQIRETKHELGIKKITKFLASTESVDLAFLLDCTGSMMPYIESVKQNIIAIVNEVTKTNPSLKIRLAIIGYRDICDGPQQFEILDFVTSVSMFRSFVSKLSAFGGDDDPEDMAGAIQRANDTLSWKQHTRATYIIADSPCHGHLYHSYPDSYPSGTPGINIEHELLGLVNKNSNSLTTMSIFFGRITSATDMMTSRFEALGIGLQTVGIEDTAKFTKAVTSSIRKSIFKSVSVVGTGTLSVDSNKTTGHKKYVFIKTYPPLTQWHYMPVRHVKVYRCNPITSVEDFKEKTIFGLQYAKAASNTTSVVKMYLRQAPNPFAEGGHRIAYFCRLAYTMDVLNRYDASAKYTLKVFKESSKYQKEITRCLTQLEISSVAYYLANLYNGQRPVHCKKVNFAKSFVVENMDNTDLSTGNACSVEELLPDHEKYTRFSNNTGYWNEDVLDESLVRFSEFTYRITDGYLMVTDLQGVLYNNEYHLTDPVILCTKILRFGATNLGRIVMKRCLNSTLTYMNENGWTV